MYRLDCRCEPTIINSTTAIADLAPDLPDSYVAGSTFADGLGFVRRSAKLTVAVRPNSALAATDVTICERPRRVVSRRYGRLLTSGSQCPGSRFLLGTIGTIKRLGRSVCVPSKEQCTDLVARCRAQAMMPTNPQTRAVFEQLAEHYAREAKRLSCHEEGPARAGERTPIIVRLQADQLASLDAWIAHQPDKLSRPEAISRLADKGLMGQ